jgi:hypothetical protein
MRGEPSPQNHHSAAELTRLIEAANRVCSASNEGQGLVVMRGALARIPQNSRNGLKVSLKRLVPRGGTGKVLQINGLNRIRGSRTFYHVLTVSARYFPERLVFLH